MSSGEFRARGSFLPPGAKPSPLAEPSSLDGTCGDAKVVSSDQSVGPPRCT